MKKFLYLLICGLLLAGCSSVSRSNNVKTVSFEPKVEPLPITADLSVSEQKATGEASGTVTQTKELLDSAVAKALGQEPPSADKPDVLVGMNVFKEITDSHLKVTVTGYPAYYTNFRTAKEEDLLRLKGLNIATLDRRVPSLDTAQAGSLPEKARLLSRYGGRAGFNMNSFSTGDSDDDDDISMGYGFAIGIAASTPIVKILTFNPELNFFYRGLYNYSSSSSGYDYKSSANEFTLSIPLMLRLMPVESVPVYASAGVQFDIPIPFSSEVEWEEEYSNGRSDSGSEDLEDRAWFDVGIALGVGYHITENLVADFRFIIGLTSLSSKSGDDSSLNQIGLGVSYLF